MNIITKQDGDKLLVHVEVEHIKGTRRSPKRYDTKYVLKELAKRGHPNLVVLKETVVYNYQTLERCVGDWVFQDLDVAYLRNKLLEVIKVPKEFVAEEEESKPKPKPKKRRTRKKKEEG
jgi:hypothetical protein